MNYTLFSILLATAIALLTAHPTSAAPRSAYEMDLDLPLSCDGTAPPTQSVGDDPFVDYVDINGDTVPRPDDFAWTTPLIVGSATTKPTQKAYEEAEFGRHPRMGPWLEETHRALESF